MYPSIDRPINSALPRQQIPLSDKLKDVDDFGVSRWQKTNMDGLEAIGRLQFFNNLKLKENYEIINGRFILQHYLDSEDYFDLASAISQEFQLPKYLRHYDITTKAVNLLLGEFLKRPDIFRVVASDSDSTNEKIRVKTELLQSYMQSQIQDEITQKLLMQGIDPNRQDFQNEEDLQKYQEEIQAKYQEMTPAAIEKYMKYDYRTAAESWGQAVISNDKERFNMRELEKIEFTDMLVADRCFNHFYLTPIGYSTEVWNPLNTFFHQSPEVRYVEDGDYAGRTFYMSKAQVLDRYGWRMTRKEQEALYPEYDKTNMNRGTGYSSLFQTWVYPFQNYDQFQTINQAAGAAVGFNPLDRNSLSSVPLMTQFDNNGVGNAYGFLQNDLIQVTEAYWRSQRRIGSLNITDPETGEQITRIVDETFDPKLYGIEEVDSSLEEHNQPDSICWVWVNQIWQGVKINENHLNSTMDNANERSALYINIKPVDFQFKGDYNIFNPKLPVCGGVFNNRNGRSMAVVDLLKPYQIYYNALYNQAYGISQRNNGKFFLMDINLLPSLKDWGGEEAYEKFMSIANSMGIGLVDTSPTNSNNRGAVPFNQYSVVDLDETEKVTRLINLAMLVEQQGFIQLGITPQRQGQIMASETLGNASAAREVSYAITETYFENFYNYKKRKLKMHLDIAQYCASQNKDVILPYITSDLGDAFIKITGTELLLKDLGVNISNANETQRQKEIAEQLVLKNNQSEIPLSKLIGLIRLQSLADVQKSLEEAESELFKRKQQEQQIAQEMQERELQAAAEEQEKQRQYEAAEKQLDRENDLRKAAITSLNFDPDIQNNGQLDVIEQAKLGIQSSQLEAEKSYKSLDLLNKQLEGFRKSKIEKEKLSTDKELKAKEIALKKAEMKNKLEVENKKKEQIEVQNNNQEKLASIKYKNELELKNKDIELKNLDIKLKQKTLNYKDSENNIKQLKQKEDLGKIKEINKDDIKTKKTLNKIRINKAKKPPKQ